MSVWVIGNGQSRSSFDLSQINGHTIGCNAIYRDYCTNEIVAVDRRMVTEILQSKYPNTIHTRSDWWQTFQNTRVVALPDVPFTGNLKADIPFHWNSGPYAILLAGRKSTNQINLLGFDIWGEYDKVNNIYKGTLNYEASTSRAVNPSHWIHQFVKLTSYYNNIEFVQHQKINWQIPQEWLSIKNLTIKYFPV